MWPLGNLLRKVGFLKGKGGRIWGGKEGQRKTWESGFWRSQKQTEEELVWLGAARPAGHSKSKAAYWLSSVQRFRQI
jgi:hypothetical protein